MSVQQIYNANYQFAVPPPRPTVSAEAGDHYVRLSWDDAAERGVDPVTHDFDFEGYRIYRATDPDFRDLQVITTATGNDIGLRKPNAQFDLADGKLGFTRKAIEGIAFDLGSDTGIRHTWTDTTVTNGQEYFYSVTAYDFGFETRPYSDSLAIFPSENSIAPITSTPRGGLVLPSNVVDVRPNVRALGYQPASTLPTAHIAGSGIGTVATQVTNSNLVPDRHTFHVTLVAPDPDSIRAESYALADSTTGTVLFTHGTDLAGEGVGPIGDGILPVVHNLIEAPEVDTTTTASLRAAERIRSLKTRLPAGPLAEPAAAGLPGRHQHRVRRRGARHQRRRGSPRSRSDRRNSASSRTPRAAISSSTSASTISTCRRMARSAAGMSSSTSSPTCRSLPASHSPPGGCRSTRSPRM